MKSNYPFTSISSYFLGEMVTAADCFVENDDRGNNIARKNGQNRKRIVVVGLGMVAVSFMYEIVFIPTI